MRRLDEVDEAEVESSFAELERAGREELRAKGSPTTAIEFLRQIDLRYVGQSYELTIPAGDDLLERFHAEHDRVYGFAAPAEAVELVSLRVASVGRIDKPPARTLEPARRPSRRSGARSTSPRPTATSTARSTTATRCLRARASPARPSSRSSTRPPSSTPASPSRSTAPAT